jgi:hypothetical protein
VRKFRRVAVSIGLPLFYAVAVYVVTHSPKQKPVYAFAQPTVVTVTE